MKLLDTIAPHISSPRIKALVQSVEAQAAARAKADLIAGILSQHERGISDPLPSDLIETLKSGKTKAEAEAPAAQRAVVKNIALHQAEKLAGDAGAINPAVAVLPLEERLRADISKDGELKVSVADPNTGKTLNNPRTGEPYTPGQFIAMMKASEEHGFLFNDGASPRPSDGGVQNPWKAAEFNLTRQCLLVRSNPELARRLKAEAAANAPAPSYRITPPASTRRG